VEFGGGKTERKAGKTCFRLASSEAFASWPLSCDKTGHFIAATVLLLLSLPHSKLRPDILPAACHKVCGTCIISGDKSLK